MGEKKRIMISFQEGGENGGPYVSHKRICDLLSDQYEFIPLTLPKGRLGILNFKLQKKIRNQIRQECPDAVHIHGLQLVGYQLMKAAKKEKKQVILAIHGFVEEAISFPKWKKIIVKCCEIFTLRKADIVYCVSDYVKNQRFIQKNVKNMYGTIYNLYHIRIDEDQSKVRKNLQIEKNDIVIVSTGRITEEKGFSDLCSAIIEWKPESKIKFLIVGEGSYLQTFKRRILDSDIKNQVFFLGYQKDVVGILKESDIFVLCTLHETLSNSIIEAQREGLPVVATDVGGIPEIIQNGENGFLVEKSNINQIVDRLKMLAYNSELREKMGLYGKKYIEKNFSEEKIKAQINELYSTLLQ